jgi:hypothetical protein
MNTTTRAGTVSNKRPATKSTVAKTTAPLKPSNKVTAAKKATKPVAKVQSGTVAKKLKPDVSVTTPVAAPKAQSSAKKAMPKVKLIRDSFTLPEADHDLIKQCKKAAIAGGRETKKSEVVRAAIRAFSDMPVSQQLAAYGKLQAIAVGRPKAK